MTPKEVGVGTVAHKNHKDVKKIIFTSLKLSDGGEYTCKVNIQSSYLSSSIIINETFVVELKSKLATEIGIGVVPNLCLSAIVLNPLVG